MFRVKLKESTAVYMYIKIMGNVTQTKMKMASAVVIIDSVWICVILILPWVIDKRA